MKKGSTQTIPVQHIPRNSRESDHDRRPQQKPKAPAKKKSSVALVISWVFIAIILGLCIFLLYLLFSGPSDGANNSSSSVRVIDFTKKNSQADSSSQVDPESSSEDDSSDTGLGEGAIMPSMIGVRLDVVKKQIGDNFTLKIEYYFSDTDERNVVVEQSIPEGTSYDPSKKVELVLKVCSGPENVPVPVYYGQDQKSYLAQLNELNIKYKVTVMRGSKAAGTVIGTSVYPGKTINVKNGEVLIVFVSDGKETVKVTTKQSEPDTQSQEVTDTQTQQSETKHTKKETEETTEETKETKRTKKTKADNE